MKHLHGKYFGFPKKAIERTQSRVRIVNLYTWFTSRCIVFTKYFHNIDTFLHGTSRLSFCRTPSTRRTFDGMIIARFSEIRQMRLRAILLNAFRDFLSSLSFFSHPSFSLPRPSLSPIGSHVMLNPQTSNSHLAILHKVKKWCDYARA